MTLYGLSTVRYAEILRRNGQELTNTIWVFLQRGLPSFPHSPALFLSITQDMVKGQPLSDDLRKVILNMARHLDVPSIHHYTGCAIRSINRLLADWRKNSTIVRDLTAQHQRGRKKILTGTNMQVCLHRLFSISSFY